MTQHHPLENILEKAADETDGESVSFGDLLELFEDRSFGPVFTLLGLLVVLPPLGAIPGLPMVIGLVVVLFAGQMMLGSAHPWVPEFIENLSVSKDKVRKAHQKSRAALKEIDSFVTKRLAWVTGKTARRIAAGVVVLLGLTMIPLEIVPFAVAAPGAAIMLIGLAVIARDGLVMLFSLAISLGVLGFVGMLLLG
mgnify:FL=1